MSERFVLATHNPGKLREMREILSELGLEVISPDEAGITVDVEETGTTFAENAMLKAKAVCELTGLPSIGDDSGLCVNALNGGPGVYSARYGGENISDAERNKLLLESVKGQGTRDAHFTCAIACAFPNGETITAEGRCDGVISYIPLGEGGFGYDPVFNYPPKLKTFAQMTPEEKSEVSHRGKALRAFAEKLGAYLSELAWNELEAEKAQQENVPEVTENPETVEPAPEVTEEPETVGPAPEVTENPESVEPAPEVTENPESAETAPEVTENPEAVETAPEVTEEPETVETAPEVTENPETVEPAPEVTENPETVEPAPEVTENPETVETAPEVTENPETVEPAPEVTENPESAETAPEVTENPETVETVPEESESAPRHHKKKKKHKKHH